MPQSIATLADEREIDALLSLFSAEVMQEDAAY